MPILMFCCLKLLAMAGYSFPKYHEKNEVNKDNKKS